MNNDIVQSGFQIVLVRQEDRFVVLFSSSNFMSFLKLSNPREPSPKAWRHSRTELEENITKSRKLIISYNCNVCSQVLNSN